MPKKSTAKKTGATKKATKKGATKKSGAKKSPQASKGATKKAQERPPRGSKGGNMVAYAISLLAKPQTREQALKQMVKEFPDMDEGKLKNRLQRLFWAIRSGAESNRAHLELKELSDDRFQIVDKSKKGGAKKKATKAA